MRDVKRPRGSGRSGATPDLPGIYRPQKGSGGLRLLKIGEEIRRTLSEVLGRRDVHHPILDAQIISITEVRVSPDVRHAFIYIACLNTDTKEMAPIFKALQEVASELRHALAQRLQLRYTPQLHFEQDTRFDRAQLIDQLLEKTRALKAQEEDV